MSPLNLPVAGRIFISLSSFHPCLLFSLVNPIVLLCCIITVLYVSNMHTGMPGWQAGTPQMAGGSMSPVVEWRTGGVCGQFRWW